MKKLTGKIWRFLKMPKHLQLFIMRLLQDQFLIGVTGVIFNNHGQVLLFKHTYRQREWSLPGGYMSSREHPAEGLEREIAEESDFVVSADDQMAVRTDRESARIEICYVGKYIGGKFKPSKEVSDYGFFDFDSLPDISRRQLFMIKDAMDLLERRAGQEKALKKLKEVKVESKSPTQSYSIKKFFHKLLG